MSTKTMRALLIGLLLASVAMIGMVLMPTEEAGALPPFSRLTDYYSDASLTNYVGFCFRNCSGGNTCDGTQTSFYVREFDYSCSGSSYCCIICSTGPCPSHILSNYPCGEC